MAYAIRIIFDQSKPELRDENRPKHLAYLQQNIGKIIAAGPLLNDGKPYGGLTIIDTDDKAEAEAFRANDPFSLCGYVTDYAIYEWRKTIFDGKDMGH